MQVPLPGAARDFASCQLSVQTLLWCLYNPWVHWSHSIFQCCIQTVPITLRQHNSKETYWFSDNYICSNCAPVTFFSKAQWACCRSMDISVLYKLSSSSSSSIAWVNICVRVKVPKHWQPYQHFDKENTAHTDRHWQQCPYSCPAVGSWWEHRA